MRLLIAGGGTGGHLYPGIAVAEEVRALPGGGEVLFVGTKRGIEVRAVPAAGFPLEILDVSALKSQSLGATVRGLGRLPRAFAQSHTILRRFVPDVVLGVGGYASGPMVLTAALAGYPTAIQEQNSWPGFTNRLLGRAAKRIFIAFDEARRYFPAHKVVFTGNPVRRALVLAAEVSRPRERAPSRLLVVGGSQGARAINDLMLQAFPLLQQRFPTLQLVHQTGAADHDRCAAGYRQLERGGQVVAVPFIEEMVHAYAAADLVVARAGALTLAELAIVGKPAILIPLPTAADDHQTHNAGAFARAGAALILPQRTASARSLADGITALLHSPAQLTAMAVASHGLARPAAAQELVRALTELAQGKTRPT